jgi:type IV pilus assembly protein PilV
MLDLKKNNRGYTLIEVLIAVIIFSIGFLSLASVQIKSITQNASARMYTEATAMAVDSLERLIFLPYDHSDLNQKDNPHSRTADGYTIEWNVQENVPVTAAKTIIVKVTGANPWAKPVTIRFVKGRTI